MKTWKQVQINLLASKFERTNSKITKSNVCMQLALKRKHKDVKQRKHKNEKKNGKTSNPNYRY